MTARALYTKSERSELSDRQRYSTTEKGRFEPYQTISPECPYYGHYQDCPKNCDECEYLIWIKTENQEKDLDEWLEQHDYLNEDD